MRKSAHKIYRYIVGVDFLIHRLRRWITDIVVKHLDQHPDNLYIRDFFLEPQLITQPPGLTYSIKFRFKAPTERCMYHISILFFLFHHFFSLFYLFVIETIWIEFELILYKLGDKMHPHLYS